MDDRSSAAAAHPPLWHHAGFGLVACPAAGCGLRMEKKSQPAVAHSPGLDFLPFACKPRASQTRTLLSRLHLTTAESSHTFSAIPLAPTDCHHLVDNHLHPALRRDHRLVNQPLLRAARHIVARRLNTAIMGEHHHLPPSPLPLLPLPSSLPSLAPLPSCPRQCRLLLGGDSCPVLTTVSSAEEEGGDQAVTGRVFGPCHQYVSPPCQSWHTHDGRIFAIRISPMVANLEQPTPLPLGPMKLKTPTVRHSPSSTLLNQGHVG